MFTVSTISICLFRFDFVLQKTLHANFGDFVTILKGKWCCILSYGSSQKNRFACPKQMIAL